jgi:DNA mismatch repair ATPase MutS
MITQQQTPLEIYAQAKGAAPDTLAMILVGDFCEMFHEDARQAARVLGLTLTSRRGSDGSIAMAGFPSHQLDGYIRKLFESGIRVALLDHSSTIPRAIETPATIPAAMLTPDANH